jgi:hypothetical protein
LIANAETELAFRPHIEAEIGLHPAVPRIVIARIQVYPLRVCHTAAPCEEGLCIGPTRWWRIQVPLSTISRILFATSEGGTGLFSGDLKSEAKRPALYGELAGWSPMRRAIAISIIPGSTISTRTLKVFISPARASLTASSAHFEAL